MKTSLALLLRRHGMVMLVTAALAASRFLPFVPDELAQLASFGALVLFLYRLNVEDRLRKTWNHFQAMPFSLAERAVARIVVPVLLYVGVHFLAQGAPTETPKLFMKIVEYFLEGSALVLVSLLATSMFRYLALAVFAIVLANATLFWLDGAVGVVAVFLLLAWSVVALSGNRVRFRRVGIPATLLGIVLAALFVWQFGWQVVEASEFKVTDKSTYEVNQEDSKSETFQVVDDAGVRWEVEKTETRRRLPKDSKAEEEEAP